MAWLIIDEKFSHIINLDAVKDTEIHYNGDSNEPKQYHRDDYYVNVRYRDPDVSMIKDKETGKETVYYHAADDVMIFRGTYRACQKAQEIIANLTNALDLEREVNRALEAEDAVDARTPGAVTEHPKGTLT